MEKRYFNQDLEHRCFLFALAVRKFCRSLKWDVVQAEDIRQLVKASGSIGANYIEANEKLGENDLRHRIRIARKEAKESVLWLGLVNTDENEKLDAWRAELIDEAQQLRKILSSILKRLG